MLKICTNFFFAVLPTAIVELQNLEYLNLFNNHIEVSNCIPTSLCGSEIKNNISVIVLKIVIFIIFCVVNEQVSPIQNLYLTVNC